MKCFNHSEISAIGICKVCSKGLCKECATDLDHGLACKDKHEEKANAIEMVISRNAKAYAEAPKNLLIMPAFFVFMGSVIAGYCLYLGRGWSNSSVVLGAGFIFFGILIWYRNRKIYQDDA